MLECPACSGLGIKWRDLEPKFCLMCDGEGELSQKDHDKKVADYEYYGTAGMDIPVEIQANAVAKARDRALRKRYGPELYDLYERGLVTREQADEAFRLRGTVVQADLQANAVAEAGNGMLKTRYGPELYDLYDRGVVTREQPDEAFRLRSS